MTVFALRTKHRAGRVNCPADPDGSVLVALHSGRFESPVEPEGEKE